ncbi:hypothetical protein [Massilia sp. Mn16-1_5]|uniref:hypothetical protein n=1 Tax=Massilia sp. Mn16-1_5 TaxID=2079199 RepID=UPI001B34725B|nr:hypothetical protein [Massilia sp. Mn16-1_5]
MSIDPVVTDANTGSSFNRYNYAKNNPFKFLDPDGRSASEPKDICAGLSRMNCGTVESSTAGRPKEFYDRSGVGPNLRGNEAVAIVEDELVSQGFIVLGREVVATTKGLEYTRRYDLVVLNPVSKNTFGVEIKSALYGPLKLNEKQVTFDVGVIKNGAVTTRGIEFDGIMYRGVDFGTKVQSVFRSATLLDKLKEAGVFPALTKPPHL